MTGTIKQEFHEKLRAKTIPHIEMATVPLVKTTINKMDKISVKCDRSGVFIRIADNHFILTASHKLEDLVNDNIPIWAILPKSKDYLLPLQDSLFMATEIDSRDIAAIKLSKAEAEQICAEKTPIDLARLELSPSLEPGFLSSVIRKIGLLPKDSHMFQSFF